MEGLNNNTMYTLLLLDTLWESVREKLFACVIIFVDVSNHMDIISNKLEAYFIHFLSDGQLPVRRQILAISVRCCETVRHSDQRNPRQ